MEPILTREELADLLTPLDETSRNQYLADAPDEDEAEQNQDSFQFDEANEKDPDKASPPVIADEPLPDIPNLDVVLDSFTRYLGARLCTVLRRSFSVERGEMRVSTFAGAMLKQQENGAMAICGMSPLPDICLVHLDQPLAFLLLETILGSTSGNEIIVPERKLSAIETALMHTGLTIICQCLEKIMERVQALSFQVLRVENDFRLLGGIDAEESCLSIFFPVHLEEEAQGVLHLLLPLRALEGLRADFAALTEVPPADARGNKAAPDSGILATPCCLRAQAQLAGVHVSSGHALSAGDLIELAEDPGRQILLMLEGQALFQAVQTPEHGQRTLRLVGRVNSGALADAAAYADQPGQSGPDPDQDDTDDENEKKQLVVEFGSVCMLMRDVLRLDVGSIVFMDKQADDSVDLYAGSKWIGRGELSCLENKKYAFRLLGPVPADTLSMED